jgi:hypothetical protein
MSETEGEHGGDEVSSRQGWGRGVGQAGPALPSAGVRRCCCRCCCSCCRPAYLVFSRACAMLHWVTFMRWLMRVATRLPSLHAGGGRQG